MEPIVPSFKLNKRDVDTGYKNDTGLYGIVCKQQSAGWCLHSRAVSVCQTLSMWYITVVSKRALSCRYVGKYRVLHSPEAAMSYFHHSLHSLLAYSVAFTNLSCLTSQLFCTYTIIFINTVCLQSHATLLNRFI